MSPTIILMAGGGLAVLLLVVGLLVSSRDERSLVDKRLEYLEEDGYNVKESHDRSAAMTEWIGKQAGRTSWGQNMTRSLARADLKLRVGEFLALTLILMVGAAALGWYFAGGTKGTSLGASMPGILLGVAVGFFAPRMYVGRLQGRRLMRFDNQLADMLNLMVNGLRAGYSIMQAMEAVSRELPPPISDEFRRVVQEMQLGVSMETALENLTRRIPSRDLALVVTAMNVQREVGGNLAEILDTISHTIRERVRVKGEIKVLTTQVMMSGKFLAVMPVFLIIAMYFLNREYMMRFFNPETRAFGIPILILGAFLIGLGYFIMTRIGDIEV
jgi:tight adherence protein B